MNPSLVVRSARLHAGMSQRQLAEAAGIHARVLDRIEAGVVQPRWDTVEKLLQVCGLDLVPGRQSDPIADGDLDFWRLSTTARLYASLGGRFHHRFDSRNGTWLELGRAAQRTRLVLAPEAALGVWLPAYQAPQPLPVLVREPVDGPALHHLSVTSCPEEPPGLVPVGVTYRHQVLVQAPLSLSLAISDPQRAGQLRAVAALFHDRYPRTTRAEDRPRIAASMSAGSRTGSACGGGSSP